MALEIKKYGKSFCIKTIEGFEIEFDEVKIDYEDKEIVLLLEEQVITRISYTEPLYQEFIIKMKKS